MMNKLTQKGKKMKKKQTIGMALFFMALLMAVCCGCSHNSRVFTLGERGNIGLDPQNFAASIGYSNGLNVIDVSRENSGWAVEVDSDVGVAVDKQTGAIKGIKKITSEVGPQITGYLVELAEKDPEFAEEYIKATKLYWEYKANKANSNPN